MTHNATGSSNLNKPVLSGLALAVLLSAAPLAAQDRDTVVTDRNPSVRDVAETPIQDLNLTKDEIPEALKDAVIAPYASEKMIDCEAITREVARLDRVLGDDLDIAAQERRDITVGKIAKSAVGSFIPFRGVIREITGAADHQRDFEGAILAGAVRRGYLKGLGEARKCPYPARPAFARITINGDDEVAYDGATQQSSEVTSDGVPFVSEPVIQGHDK